MTKQLKLNISAVFPDHINTDDIIPGWTLQESTERTFFGRHAFSNYDPEFIVRTEQFSASAIIAGENFGSGSSREQAIYALLENNVKVVIAKSFPDIFYRNALNNGLILIQAKEIAHFSHGDEIIVDLETMKIFHKDLTHDFEMEETDRHLFSIGGKTKLVQDYLGLILRRKADIPGEFYKYKPKKKTKPQNMTEKILSSHIHKDIYTGEYVENIPIDVLFINDAFGPAVIEEYNSSFGHIYDSHKKPRRIFDPERVFFIADHDCPPSTIGSANGIKKMREFSYDQKCDFYKPGDGIEHVVLIEDGFIVPGSMNIGTDSHTCTAGALNTLSFGVGTTEAAYSLATGHIHGFKVPASIRINLSGEFQKGVYAKDLILYIIGILGVHGANKKVLEFGGSGLKNLSIDGRTTIANMAVEMGARSAVFEHDDILEDYINPLAIFKYKPVLPDPNCVYDLTIDIQLSDIQPCVAFPHKPDNVTFISKIGDYMKESQKINSGEFPAVTTLNLSNAFLGACTNGKYEDLVEAAKVLKNRTIHEDIDFVVIPGSRKIYNRLLEEGILKIFAEAGANIESSTCGPCYGKHKGLVPDGGQIISSSNRNFMGRMGSKNAKVFLASPVTVAASAIEGKIADPRKYL